MAEQERDPAFEERDPSLGENREQEHERVRSSNDRDQELEHNGEPSRHNTGYDQAVRGITGRDSGGIEDVDRIATDDE